MVVGDESRGWDVAEKQFRYLRLKGHQNLVGGNPRLGMGTQILILGKKVWEERGLKAHSRNSDFGTPMT